MLRLVLDLLLGFGELYACPFLSAFYLFKLSLELTQPLLMVNDLTFVNVRRAKFYSVFGLHSKLLKLIKQVLPGLLVFFSDLLN